MRSLLCLANASWTAVLTEWPASLRQVSNAAWSVALILNRRFVFFLGPDLGVRFGGRFFFEETGEASVSGCGLLSPGEAMVLVRSSVGSLSGLAWGVAGSIGGVGGAGSGIAGSLVGGGFGAPRLAAGDPCFLRLPRLWRMPSVGSAACAFIGSAFDSVVVGFIDCDEALDDDADHVEVVLCEGRCGFGIAKGFG